MKAVSIATVSLLSLMVLAATAALDADESAHSFDSRLVEQGDRGEIGATRDAETRNIGAADLDVAGAARARLEAIAREHETLYEQWLHESRKRDLALAREGQTAHPEAPDEPESG